MIDRLSHTSFWPDRSTLIERSHAVGALAVALRAIPQWRAEDDATRVAFARRADFVAWAIRERRINDGEGER